MPTFRIKDVLIGRSLDGSFAKNRGDTTFDIGNALAAGGGRIVTSDPAEVQVLRALSEHLDEVADGTPAQSYRRMTLAEAGLLAYWPLEDAALPAVDPKGARNLNTGDAASVQLGQASLLTSDPDGRAANFLSTATSGGLSRATEAALAFVGHAAMTVEAWVEVTDVSTRTIVNVRDSSANAGWTLVCSASSGFQLARGDGAGSTSASQGAHPGNGVYHVAGTYDGEASRLYVNGALAAGPSGARALVDPALPLAIGRSASDLTGGDWVGRLQHVSLYTRALTLAEIARRYEVGKALHL